MRNLDLKNSLSREETAHLAGVMQEHNIGGISPYSSKKPSRQPWLAQCHGPGSNQH